MCVGCLLVVAWAYERLIHARGPLDRLTGFMPRQRPSRSTTNKQPIHALSQPCIQSSINHPPINSPTHPFTHPFNHPPIRSPIHSPTRPPFPSPTHPFTNPSFHSPIYPYGCMDGWMNRWVG